MTQRIKDAFHFLLEFLPADLVLVGGAVRDLQMGIEPNDLDFATSLSPAQMMDAAFRAGVRCLPTGVGHGTVTFMMGNIPLEVTTFRADRNCDGRHADVEFGVTLEEDLSRRDFTMNAMAMDVDGTITDPFGGRRDIANRVIRFVGDAKERIREDFLRAPRAIEFECRFLFDLDSEAEKALSCLGDEVMNNISVERMTTLFCKGLLTDRAGLFIRELSFFGILEDFLPEIDDLFSVPQKPEHHPEGDAGIHTCLVVDGVRKDLTVRLAALFHDVGKTKTLDRDTLSCHGHDTVGARMIEGIFRRIKLPLSLVKPVARVARLHMRPHFLGNDASAKARRKFHSQAGEFLDLIKEVHIADCMGRRHHSEGAFIAAGETNPVVRGKHFVAAGIKPGPMIGRLVHDAHQIQLETGVVHIETLVSLALEGAEV